MNTKESIAEAAVYLFYIKGFSATSIRDISARAGVNSANISYYFQNKQGLLEYCCTSFFESYMKILEDILTHLSTIGPKQCLLNYSKQCLQFYREHYYLTRFVLRETTIESRLNQEIFMTYLSKEKYFFKKILEEGKHLGIMKVSSVPMFVIQLKAMLNEPFIQSQYLMEVWQQFPNEPYFITEYFKELECFLEQRYFITVPVSI